MTNSVSRVPRKGIRAWSTRVLGLASMVSMLACGSQESGPTQSAADEAKSKLSVHKVQLSTQQAQALEERGAQFQVLADYGSYKLVQVDEKALASLPEGAEIRDSYNEILLNAGTINTATAHGQSLRGMRMQAGGGKRLHLVQFSGPVKPEWYKDMVATGVQVVNYIPNNTYMVYGDAVTLGKLQQHMHTKGSEAIQWDGEFLPDFKLHPTVHTSGDGAFEIQLFKDEGTNTETLALINQLQRGDGKLRESLSYVNVIATLTVPQLQQLAARPDVLSIIPHITPTKNDERQNMIVSGNLNGTQPRGPGWLEQLSAWGFSQAQFTQSNFVVDVTDSGVDNALPATPNHFGLYTGGAITANGSRLVYARLEGTPNGGSTIQGCDGHGTINAHIVGGYNARTGAPHEDALGFNYGMGVAPFVKVASSVIFDPGAYTFPDYEDMLSRGFRDNTRISSNSWGAASSIYNADSQAYDALTRDSQPANSAVPAPGNQEMVMVFAAGNSGSGAGSIIRPANAKNVIAVGASENVHPFGGPDLCAIADSGADSAMDIISFSSRGPTADGRKKPDIMAPGTHVTGGVAQADGQRNDNPGNPNGAALGCFDASGVCAGPGINFFPAGQQWSTASSGTSHSTPAVAGGAALVRQYFINHGMAPPSPAMTKAYLMNSARYMTGVSANDNLWSNNQGMGLMDLGMSFDGVPRTLDDQNPANLFTASGQTRTFTGAAGDPAKPFRVTLAWTDAPGATTGNAWNNNLDLTVTVDGTTYRGNVFTGSRSVTGGTADDRNNVESVFLPAGTTGNFTITVTAANIVADAVPGNASALDQDFALVAYNTCGTTPSGPITDVTATVAGDNAVTLSWTNNDAERYNVYRATTAGGPYTKITTVASSPYQDESVSGGTTYYYVVRGALCVESPAGNEASVTATGACTLLPTFAGVGDVSNDEAATCGTTVTWTAGTPACDGTLTYSVYRSLVPGFTPSIANRIATGLTGTSFADNLNLTTGTPYYYVVRATETAEATVEEQNTEEESATPTGEVTDGAHFDDLDENRPPNADAYWIPTTQSGAAGTINLTAGCHYQSETRSWRFGAANSTNCGGTYPNSVQATLVMGGNGTNGVNGFMIPSTPSPAMSFHIWHSFETGWDGAWLVYSTTGANGPWTPVGDTASATVPYISSGGYTGTISGVSNRVWSGSSANPNGALKAVAVNLTALAGQQVWFGFRFRTDGSIVAEGFYVDEIRLDAAVPGECTTNTPPPGPAVAYRIDNLPATSGAGEAVSFDVTALDAVGLTAIDYAGTASFTSSDAQAQLPANATFTAGVASNISVEFRTLGNRSITATDVENTAITGSASTMVTAGPAAGVGFTRQPGNAVAGVAIAPSVRVGLVDRFGNAVTTGTNSITVALGNNPGNGSLAGTTTVAAVAGVANFADLSIEKIGAGYTLVASSDGLTSATSAGFAITPAAPAELEVTTQPSSTVAGESISPAIRVLIKDQFGNPTLATNEVYAFLDSNPSGGTLSGTDAVSAADGTATFGDLWIDKVGEGYTVVFVSEGGPDGFMVVTSDGFDITPAAPFRTIITRQPSDTPVGRPITPSVEVTILDRFDNIATQATRPVSAALGSNPRNAQLRGRTSMNPVSGIATFSDLSVSKAGENYTLIFGSSGLHSATSVGFDVTSRQGAVDKLAFRPVAETATAGAAIGTIEVELQDSDGNLLDGESQLVTLSLGENPANGELSGSTSVSAVAGVAKFEGISLRKAGSGYSLVARADGFESATSSAFAVNPGAAASFAVTAAASIGAGEETSISATAYDAYGNVAASYGGTVRVTSSDNSATLGSNATFVEGKLNNFKVTFKSKGSKTVTLTDTSNANLTSTAMINVTPFGQPIASVTSPEGGLAVSGTVNITVTGAVAAGNTLAKLQILVDGVEIASGTDAELSGSWNSDDAEAGSHIITAAVTDGAGNVVTSAPVIVFKDGGCGCGATSGTDAAFSMGLLVLAWYLLRRREKKTLV